MGWVSGGLEFRGGSVCGCGLSRRGRVPGCPLYDLVNREMFLFADGGAGLDHDDISLHALLHLIVGKEILAMTNVLKSQF